MNPGGHSHLALWFEDEQMAEGAQGLFVRQGLTHSRLTQASAKLHSLSDEQPLGGGGPNSEKISTQYYIMGLFFKKTMLLKGFTYLSYHRTHRLSQCSLGHICMTWFVLAVSCEQYIVHFEHKAGV